MGKYIGFHRLFAIYVSSCIVTLRGGEYFYEDRGRFSAVMDASVRGA